MKRAPASSLPRAPWLLAAQRTLAAGALLLATGGGARAERCEMKPADYEPERLLLDAADRGDEAEVERTRRLVAHIDAACGLSRTALRRAVRGGHLGIVRRLIDGFGFGRARPASRSALLSQLCLDTSPPLAGCRAAPWAAPFRGASPTPPRRWASSGRAARDGQMFEEHPDAVGKPVTLVLSSVDPYPEPVTELIARLRGVFAQDGLELIARRVPSGRAAA